jgi:hypothetical protein
MATALMWMLGYVLAGLGFAWHRWEGDWDRAERARVLRAALDMKPNPRPLWCEVVAVGAVRVLAWPLHLIIHDL